MSVEIIKIVKEEIAAALPVFHLGGFAQRALKRIEEKIIARIEDECLPQPREEEDADDSD